MTPLRKAYSLCQRGALSSLVSKAKSIKYFLWASRRLESTLSAKTGKDLWLGWVDERHSPPEGQEGRNDLMAMLPTCIRPNITSTELCAVNAESRSPVREKLMRTRSRKDSFDHCAYGKAWRGGLRKETLGTRVGLSSLVTTNELGPRQVTSAPQFPHRWGGWQQHLPPGTVTRAVTVIKNCFIYKVYIKWLRS